jgi:hypothetical protein
MPDIRDYWDILQSDQYAYRSIKDEFEKFDSAKDHNLPAEHSDMPVDKEILRLIEENKMHTDPDSLRGNFNELLDKLSRIFGAIKRSMVTWGQNINKRNDIYEDFERIHPTKLVYFHKDKVWYEFLVTIASHGGKIDTSLLVEMYGDRFNHLMELTVQHGFARYMQGGNIVMMNPPVVSEILFREHTVAVSPNEVINRNYYKSLVYDIIRAFRESRREQQLKMLKKIEDKLLGNDIRQYVEISWIIGLNKGGINNVHQFVKTSSREIAKLISVSLHDINVSKLSLVSYFKMDMKSLDVDVFDYGIFRNMHNQTPNIVTKCLYDNKINTWGEFFDADIEKIEAESAMRKINLYRLMAFGKYFYHLLKDNDRFFYKPIMDEFKFHEHLPKSYLDKIKEKYKQDPEKYLNTIDKDKQESVKA